MGTKEKGTKIRFDRTWNQYSKFSAPVKKIKVNEKTIVCMRNLEEWEVVSVDVGRNCNSMVEDINVRIRRKSSDKRTTANS